MSRTPLLIGLLLAGMIHGGCATSPWTTGQNSAGGWVKPSFTKPTATAATSAKPNVQKLTAPPANNQANSQAMQEVMEELRQLGTLDPAAQNNLMEDLKQTDPALWPLVMQQFRAAVAHKRRAALSPLTAANAVETSKVQKLPSVVDSQSAGGMDQTSASNEAPAAATSSNAMSPANHPAAADQPAASQKVQDLVNEQPVKETGNSVVSASYNEESFSEPGDWRKHLCAAIKSLEGSTPKNTKAEEELAQQARLRMLYVLADRRDEALKPIPGAGPGMQEFWSKEFYGLAMLLDTQEKPDAFGRAAESKQVLSEALARLGEKAPLVVRNLAFCTAVQSYGCYTPFKQNEFSPDQEVLLYAEMENFAAECTPKGYHTVLRSSYQIFDVGGNRVADHTFTTTEEYCQNPRRDFFIGFHLRVPQRINPGKYTLQLTIEDVKSQKVGQSSIEFSIKEAEK